MTHAVTKTYTHLSALLLRLMRGCALLLSQSAKQQFGIKAQGARVGTGVRDDARTISLSLSLSHSLDLSLSLTHTHSTSQANQILLVNALRRSARIGTSATHTPNRRRGATHTTFVACVMCARARECHEYADAHAD